MSDLIERQAAIDILMKEWKAYKDYPYVSHVRHGLEIAIAILDNKVPSAQRTGRWEYVKKRLVRGGYVDASECSVCHKRIMPHLKPNFCPNCGAKMQEVEE